MNNWCRERDSQPTSSKLLSPLDSCTYSPLPVPMTCTMWPEKRAHLDTKNLKRRHQTWYARVAVPPSLQSILGKAEIVRSLGTRDLREANRKKHRVLADITEM